MLVTCLLLLQNTCPLCHHLVVLHQAALHHPCHSLLMRPCPKTFRRRPRLSNLNLLCRVKRPARQTAAMCPHPSFPMGHQVTNQRHRHRQSTKSSVASLRNSWASVWNQSSHPVRRLPRSRALRLSHAPSRVHARRIPQYLTFPKRHMSRRAVCSQHIPKLRLPLRKVPSPDTCPKLRRNSSRSAATRSCVESSVSVDSVLAACRFRRMPLRLCLLRRLPQHRMLRQRLRRMTVTLKTCHKMCRWRVLFPPKEVPSRGRLRIFLR